MNNMFVNTVCTLTIVLWVVVLVITNMIIMEMLESQEQLVACQESLAEERTRTNVLNMALDSTHNKYQKEFAIKKAIWKLKSAE